MHAVNSVNQNNLAITVKAAETVNQINQMIVDTNQNLQDKMINLNVEQKLQDLKAEGIGRELNLLA